MLGSHPIVASIEDTYNKMLKLKENLLDWMKEDSMWVEEKQLLDNLKLEEIVKVPVFLTQFCGLFYW